MRHLTLFILFVFLSGCAGSPDTTTKVPWFKTNPDLKEKESDLLSHTLSMIDNNGLLCYRAFLPMTDSENYIDSHDVADGPAWQGYLMMAAAFKEAVSGEDQDPLILKLSNAFIRCFSVTGVNGLLGRSWIPDYFGTRRDWMETESDRPTKFWMKNSSGQWWRNGLAKDHWNLAVTGCAVPLLLHRRGAILLNQGTRDSLKGALVAMVRHLADGGWRLRDWDGRFTEFGDLRPGASVDPNWPSFQAIPNGFNMALVLNGLRSAGEYDSRLMELYEEKAILWSDNIGLSMEAVGEFVKSLGHWRIGKPSYSDMQAYALASMSLLLQEDRRDFTKGYKRGMSGLWEYMRYERNAPFTLTYVALVRPDQAGRVAEVLEDLRDFPGSDMKVMRGGPRRDGSHVQPLANRPVNTNYWKSSPFRHITGPQDIPVLHPTTGAELQMAAMDYLLAYWMGRYFGLIPER